jgi:hypothetical protein
MRSVRADHSSIDTASGRAIDASRELADALNSGQIALGPMRRDELRQVIESPAKLVGLEFEPGLVNRILDDVAEAQGSLPLVEYALTQLWDARRGRVLTAAAYDGFGGVAGAIAAKADEAYNRLSAAEKLGARALVGRLVRAAPADSEGTDSRQRATRSEIGEAGWQIASKLAQPRVRLLVLGRDLQTAEETAEVAHEALIKNWTTLANWLREDRDFLLWRQRLQVFLSIWEQSGGADEATLLRGPALVEALKWRNSHGGELNDHERSFIECSDAARRRSSRLRALGRRAAIATVALAATAGLLWFGYSQTDAYQFQEIEADALKLINTSDVGKGVLPYFEALG